MKEETYEVGQIIYLLSTKNTKVFPAKITEEIVRKTINESVRTERIFRMFKTKWLCNSSFETEK